MNSKAIRRQLLAAVAMVLVAAVALGSSTYAWFVASGTVTATGMKVQAQTDAGLTIRYKKGTWGTSATAAMDTAMKLYPASTADLQKWYHATADSANSYAAKVGTREEVTSSVFPSGTYADNGYVLMRQFEIASTATDTNALVSGLKVSKITVTTPASTMSTALRVGIEYVAGTGESAVHHTRIFAPVTLGDGDANNPTKTYGVYKDKVTGNVHEDDLVKTVTVAEPGDVGEIVENTHPTNAIVVPEDVTFPAKSSNGLLVNIYIWFEGEDHNLNTDNFGADELSVTVEFTGMNTGSGTAATKVDLSGATITDAEATNKTVAGVTYYEISGATAANGSKLYADKATWSAAPQVYTISDAGLVTNYTDNVKLPTTT